jgi:hypothetical protein
MKIHPKGISVILLFMMLVILIISLLTALTSFDSTYNVLIWRDFRASVFDVFSLSGKKAIS